MRDELCDICPLTRCNAHSELCVQTPQFKLELHREVEKARQINEQKYAPLYTGCGTWDRSAAKKGLMRKRI